MDQARSERRVAREGERCGGVRGGGDVQHGDGANPRTLRGRDREAAGRDGRRTDRKGHGAARGEGGGREGSGGGGGSPRRTCEDRRGRTDSALFDRIEACRVTTW